MNILVQTLCRGHTVGLQVLREPWAQVYLVLDAGPPLTWKFLTPLWLSEGLHAWMSVCVPPSRKPRRYLRWEPLVSVTRSQPCFTSAVTCRAQHVVRRHGESLRGSIAAVAGARDRDRDRLSPAATGGCFESCLARVTRPVRHRVVFEGESWLQRIHVAAISRGRNSLTPAVTGGSMTGLQELLDKSRQTTGS